MWCELCKVHKKVKKKYKVWKNKMTSQIKSGIRFFLDKYVKLFLKFLF